MLLLLGSCLFNRGGVGIFDEDELCVAMLHVHQVTVRVHLRYTFEDVGVERGTIRQCMQLVLSNAGSLHDVEVVRLAHEAIILKFVVVVIDVCLQ